MARRMERDSVRIAQAVLQRVSERGPLPFELRVLEALLDETARQVRCRTLPPDGRRKCTCSNVCQ